MKKLLLSGACLLMAGTSQAAQIHCEGSYFFYHMVAEAESSGNQIVGDVMVTITGLSSPTTMALTPSSSDVREGQYIRATGESDKGSGQLATTYDAPSKTYLGTLKANTTMGNANVRVVCTMTGSRNPEFDLSPYEAYEQGLYPQEQQY
jgi:hypothetical protein